MEETKYVPMFTWVCICGKEYRWELSKLPHGFDMAGCLACNIKDGDRVPIKVCRCKIGLDKQPEL
jgi:hypothetical protein